MTAREVLDGIKRRAENFLTARLTAAVEGVLALHKEADGRILGFPPAFLSDHSVCLICFTDDGWPTPYPCPTVVAIKDALEG